MASTKPNGLTKAVSRPISLRTAKSFSQSDPLTSTSSSPRNKRASTIQNGAPPGIKEEVLDPLLDAFDTTSSPVEVVPEVPRGSIDLDDLPIELIGLTDSFIESLSVTSQPVPPNIDNISRLFQDFYAQAAAHVDTHINTLLLRITREGSPAPSVSSRTSIRSLPRNKVDRPKLGTASSSHGSQQMITTEEMAQRKKARRAVEQQRGTLEEAVERRLCEGVYGKIYRHQSTQDADLDGKLRSKTAALAVVGIGLSDLGVELGSPSESPIDVSAKVEEVRRWLDGARDELKAMHNSRYPFGKLNHLRAAHQSIVDTLTQFHPSSSADEIMPMLIYTLITMPPEHLHVISDLNFIERFRWQPKLTGEAAYCMTNLEACISFLDTVDLSTLRPNEHKSGSSRPTTPRLETFPPAFTNLDHAGGADYSTRPSKPPASPGLLRAGQLRNRRFSDLVSTPAQAIGAASDAVRNTADQGMKTISNSLGDSYKFLMGRLRESDEDGAAASTSRRDIVIPKTLDDARRLISPTSVTGDDAVSIASSEGGTTRPPPPPIVLKDDKVMSLFGGKASAAAAAAAAASSSSYSREHSADSSRSGGSGNFHRRAQTEMTNDGDTKAPPLATSVGGSVVNPEALIDSVRNLGNSLNPMTRIAGIGPFRGFGRTSSSPATPQLKSMAGGASPLEAGVAEGGDLSTAFPDIARALPPKEMKKINPPSKRFMEMQNPGDLRIGEVLELLRDYRRLAGALKELDAFKS